jgi:hypothetical protein
MADNFARHRQQTRSQLPSRTYISGSTVLFSFHKNGLEHAAAAHTCATEAGMFSPKGEACERLCCLARALKTFLTALFCSRVRTWLEDRCDSTIAITAVNRSVAAREIPNDKSLVFFRLQSVDRLATYSGRLQQQTKKMAHVKLLFLS